VKPTSRITNACMPPNATELAGFTFFISQHANIDPLDGARGMRSFDMCRSHRLIYPDLRNLNNKERNRSCEQWQ
jgi:hypothetical protein